MGGLRLELISAPKLLVDTTSQPCRQLHILAQRFQRAAVLQRRQ